MVTDEITAVFLQRWQNMEYLLLSHFYLLNKTLCFSAIEQYSGVPAPALSLTSARYKGRTLHCTLHCTLHYTLHCTLHYTLHYTLHCTGQIRACQTVERSTRGHSKLHLGVVTIKV